MGEVIRVGNKHVDTDNQPQLANRIDELHAAVIHNQGIVHEAQNAIREANYQAVSLLCAAGLHECLTVNWGAYRRNSHMNRR
jgi:hypothetical protein